MNDVTLKCEIDCTISNDVINKVLSITGLDKENIYVIPVLNGHKVTYTGTSDYSLYDLFTSWGSSFNISELKNTSHSAHTVGASWSSIDTMCWASVSTNQYAPYLNDTNDLTCSTTISFCLIDKTTGNEITSIEASEPITKTFTFVEG